MPKLSKWIKNLPHICHFAIYSYLIAPPIFHWVWPIVHCKALQKCQEYTTSASLKTNFWTCLLWVCPPPPFTHCVKNYPFWAAMASLSLFICTFWLKAPDLIGVQCALWSSGWWLQRRKEQNFQYVCCLWQIWGLIKKKRAEFGMIWRRGWERRTRKGKAKNKKIGGN